MSFQKSPVAVALARTLLVVIAVITLALGAGLYFSGVVVPAWQWALIASVGTVSLLSACFESATGVVATVIMFFSPIG
jgi:hypothetical protein